MALTAEEQKQLAQLEAALAFDDPQLATTLRGHALPRRVHQRTLAIALVGVAAGATLMVLGLQAHWLLSVLGFVVMFASGVHGTGALPPVYDDDVPLDDRFEYDLITDDVRGREDA